jgi:hypothetical protein
MHELNAQEDVDLAQRQQLVVGAVAVRLDLHRQQQHDEREHGGHDDLHGGVWRDEGDEGGEEQLLAQVNRLPVPGVHAAGAMAGGVCVRQPRSARCGV